jgi:hypothetical protein
MSTCELQEEVNEVTVQYVGGGLGPPKTEDFLPESTPIPREDFVQVCFSIHNFSGLKKLHDFNSAKP